MKNGDKVKVICSIDSACPAEYIGRIGIVIEAVFDMGLIKVKFEDDLEDAYWPEELEKIE